MTVEPVFVDTLENLLKATRIETATDEQTVACVHSCVSEVRIGFYERLGITRTTSLVDIPPTENPNDQDGLDRRRAETTEILWLTVKLMERLPTMFMSAGSTAENEIFNTEPLTREQEPDNYWHKINSLRKQVDDNLLALSADEDAQSSAIKASSIGPDEVSLIGDVFPGRL